MKHTESVSIRRLAANSILLIVVASGAAGFGLNPQQVRSESWMYNRSYYSHQLPPEVAARYPRPQSRSAYRVPELATTPGFALRGARRWNYVRLYSGNSYDTTIFRSDTFNVVPP